MVISIAHQPEQQEYPWEIGVLFAGAFEGIMHYNEDTQKGMYKTPLKKRVTIKEGHDPTISLEGGGKQLVDSLHSKRGVSIGQYTFTPHSAWKQAGTFPFWIFDGSSTEGPAQVVYATRTQKASILLL